MRIRRGALALASGLVSCVLAVGMTVASSGAASAASVPSHVFAPYFEAWTGQSPATLSQQSGAKWLTMAFLQTAAAGSCTVYWNGTSSMPVSSSVFGSDFSTMRSNGGGTIPSFGGYSADTGGTEIADSCTSVSSIAGQLENVVTTYNVNRIDFDVEANSLTNSAGIDRRNKAIAQVETWAASTGHSVQFSYTFPTFPTGLQSDTLAVLQNAISNKARIDVVNIMTFDYYLGTTQEMATDTETAAAGLESQLASLYPTKSSSQLWGMIGVTEMIGIDDFGSAETFTTSDGSAVKSWAVSKGIDEISFWALQRDNGGCPGVKGQSSCSGIAQTTWSFSQTFEPFTGGGSTTTSNDFSISLSSASGSVTVGGSTSTTVKTAVTSGSAETVSLSASGQPAGVTIAFSPSSLTSGSSSTMKLTSSSSVASGTYGVTVKGSASSGSHSVTYSLKVGTGGTGSTALTNGGFESGTFSPWTCQPGDAVVSSPVHSGSRAALISATSSQTGECDQTVTLSPNTTHTLTGWVQGSYAYIGVSGGASASTWTSSSNWSQLSVTFTTGSTGSVTVFVHGWYGQGNVYADDFALS